MSGVASFLKYALCLVALWAIILLPALLPHRRHDGMAVAHMDSPAQTRLIEGAS